MRSLIFSTPAYELSVDFTSSKFGHSLQFVSVVPTARRPEEQVKFQALLDTTGLTSLRDLVDQALADAVAHPTTEDCHD